MEEKSLFLTENIKQEPEEEFVIILPSFKSDETLLGIKRPEKVTKKITGRRNKDSSKNGENVEKKSKEFVCDLCGRNKKKKSQMIRHLHAHAKPFINECGESFSQSCLLDIQKLSHQKNRPMFGCDLCSAIYSNESSLYQHVKDYHSSTGETFMCEKCDYRGKTRRHLKRHQKSHERAFKCTKCEKDFCRNEGLKNHMKSHDRPDSWVCLCTRVFNSLRAFSRHKKMVHKPGQPIKLEDGKICCKICNRNFTEKGNLARHIKIHGVVIKTKCPICSKMLIADSMKRHMRRHQTKDEGRRFKCHQCSKRYFTDSDLKYHWKFHEKKFLCDFCDGRFALKKDIRNHVLIHMNPDTFKCKICLKRFSNKSYLNFHTRKFHISIS